MITPNNKLMLTMHALYKMKKYRKEILVEISEFLT